MNPKDRIGSKKAPLGLVPPALEIGAAEAMENGATKYGPFNWRDQPVEYMTYLVAMKRHIAALIDGEDLAEDSGIHHLKHIAAGAGILLDALNIPGDLIDNRPPKGPASRMLAEQDKTQPVQEEPVIFSDDPDMERGLRGLDFDRAEQALQAYDKGFSGLGYSPAATGKAIERIYEQGLSAVSGCTCPPSRVVEGEHLVQCPHFRP